MERLINPLEAAKTLGIKLPTIYTWVARRKIPFVKVGAALRFRPSALEDWVKGSERMPGKLDGEADK